MVTSEPVRLSLVVRMYEVERYLPDFLDSLGAQQPGPYQAELLLVDDGSPDGSGQLAADWLAEVSAESLFTGQVISQANAGPSAAANAGLDAATGDWISWPDPDDMLDEGYLSAVAEFILANGDQPPATVDTKLVMFTEPDGLIEDSYVYRFKYESGARVASLAAEPTLVTGRTNNVFFQLPLVREFGLRFDPRVRASEDELFVASYLLQVDDPRVGVLPEALYLYRRRAAGGGLAAEAVARPDFLTIHMNQVALPLGRLAAERNQGRIP
ncbi:MAG: glycosyltransferase, partial [Bifidobacteriaceae bacterium]|nr:glycosyltransferase [Bifidobacteriaceae bacterium]